MLKTVELGKHRFSRIVYEEIPVYLYVGETGNGAETPEGHIVWYDLHGEIVGVTIVSP